MTDPEKSQLTTVLTELYQVKRVLNTSTVSYCRERLELSIERLERLLVSEGAEST
jgi:hypothetical protein